MAGSNSMHKSTLLLCGAAIICLAAQSNAELKRAYSISSIAGTGAAGFAGDGGAAIRAQISQPRDVAVDNEGNVFFTDYGNNRIRKISTKGTITTIAGTEKEGFGGEDAAASSALLYKPLGIAVDLAGNVYFVDQGNNRVRRISNTGRITTVAGNGEYGYSGDGGPALFAQIGHPYGVAVDDRGNVFVSELDNQRIRKIDKSGIITTIAGTGTGKYNGDGIQATSATLCYPSGMAIDKAGNLYVADRGNDRIRKITMSGIITTIAGGGDNEEGDGEAATEAKIDKPTGIAVDWLGNIYFSESSSNRIRRVDTNGKIYTIAGDGSFGYNGDAIDAKSAKLGTPMGVAVDNSGGVYITDTNNHRLRLVR